MAELQYDPTTGEPKKPGSAFFSEGDLDPQAAGATALRSPSLLAQGQKYMGKTEAAIGQAEKDYAAREKQIGPMQQDLLDVLKSPHAAQAHLEKIKDEPKPEDYQKYSMEFASAMALIGAIGGRGTRNAGNASLNAFAGALKGWKEGNLQAYENARKEWEQATRKTIENNNAELQKYQMILNDKKLTIDQMSAAISLVAAEHGNKIAFDFSQAQNYTALGQFVDRLAGVRDKLANATDVLTGYSEADKAKLVGQINALNKNPEEWNRLDEKSRITLMGAADTFGVKTNIPQVSSQVESMVDEVGSYKVPLGSVTSRLPPAMKEQFFDRLQQKYPDFNAQKYTQESRALGAFGTGTQGNAIRAFNVAIPHLDTMEQLTAALQTNNVQVLNRLQNTLRTEFGSGAVPSFNFAKEVVGDEITKAILGTGIGSQQDRLALKAQFDAARSPQALHEVVLTAKRMMADQLAGFKKQYEYSTGQTDFEQMLFPRTQEMLQQVQPQLEKGGGAPGGGTEEGWGELKVH